MPCALAYVIYNNFVEIVYICFFSDLCICYMVMYCVYTLQQFPCQFSVSETFHSFVMGAAQGKCIVGGGVVISLPLDLQGVTSTDACSLTCPARKVLLLATQPLSRSQGH